jgi:hypothetical protein
VSVIKRVLVPKRLRRVPPQFSWIDQRLVRAGFIDRCDPPAAALYLFLVTVADAQGLSYYGDATIGRHLKLMPAQLSSARERLIQADLIAFEAPLYQVLALPTNTSATVTSPAVVDRAQARARLQRLREQLRGTP